MGKEDGGELGSDGKNQTEEGREGRKMKVTERRLRRGTK